MPDAIDMPMVAAMFAKELETMKDITKEQPIGRLGKPEQIASAVLWLCSPGAGFVIGHALAIDGGYPARELGGYPAAHEGVERRLTLSPSSGPESHQER